MLDSLLNPVFGPLLEINLFLAICIVSFIMSLIITLVYKMMTDQSLMKDLKGEIKQLQKQMKELRNHPDKMMKVQKKVMDTNMKYMMHSMKPTLITFLPIIIIFGWLNAHLAYEPLLPNQEFTTTATMVPGATGKVELKAPEGIILVSDPEQEIINGQASWTLKGDGGVYLLEYAYNENDVREKEVTISTEKEYSDVRLKIKDKNSAFKEITLSNRKTKPLGDLSIFGWQPGWLAVYIILSIVFSMGLRKALKIY